MKMNKLPEAPQHASDQNKKTPERAELLREFRSAERTTSHSSVGGVCILLAFLALSSLVLYVFLTASYSTSGMLLLPREFPTVAVVIIAGYVLLCIAILLISRHVALSRFLKKQRAASTDTSAIRLFKEKIDLPYVITNADGKIIVANRAFEDAVSGKYSSIGEDIRDICKVALDSIIRTTTAESATDQKIREVHTAAVRAYPAALHQTATADACLNLLREIDTISLSLGSSEELDPNSPLLRVHEIASSAFREAEKRSELWHLCLGTLDNVLSASAADPKNKNSERLAHIYELARSAYKAALEKETEALKENTIRDFRESLEKIVLIAEADPTAGQLYSAFRLRLDMFCGKDLFPHVRTLLLNIRQQIAQSLPDPTVVTNDKDTLTLQVILKLVDEGLSSLRAPREENSDDRERAVSILVGIVRAAESAGASSINRSIHTIREIADAGLCALLPERTIEYVSLVTRELLLATADRRDTSATDAEIYEIASAMQETVRNGNREDEERFISSFRDAVRRIAEESRFGDRIGSEADRIRSIIEKAVSGSLSFLELRTSGVATLSDLSKYGEETLTLRDITKNDQKLISASVTEIKSLQNEILSLSAPTPSSALALSQRIERSLYNLLSKFDENADYGSIRFSGEDERSALARARIFYSELERAASASFPLSSIELSSSVFDRASAALMGYPLYESVILRATEAFPRDPEPGTSLRDRLPEVSQPEYATCLWFGSAELALLHIGVLRIYGSRKTPGALSDLQSSAEALYEKLAIRRILTEILVEVPINAISGSARENAPAEVLYRLSLSHFRESTAHRSRILLTACRVLIEEALSFLEKATNQAALASEEEKLAFTELRRETDHARVQLLSCMGTSPSDDLISLSEDILKRSASTLQSFAKKESVAGIYHAALSYLSEFFSDLNGRLLRREFFRTYRDTSLEIVSELHRAEYTLTAIEEIRKITNTVLSTEKEKAISFSGLSLKDCCSADLRTIAGLSGTDVVAELAQLSDTHAKEALSAKALWELRRQTLRRIARRLDHTEECCRFHDKVLVPHRNEIAHLRKAINEGGFLPASNKQKENPAEISPEVRVACRDRIVSESKTIRNGVLKNSNQPESIGYRLDKAIASLLESQGAPLPEFVAQLKPFHELLNHISSETLSFRRNKKRFLLLRKSLAEEDSISFIPKTGAPLSRQSVYELFTEYLNATLHTVRAVREGNPAMNDIFHIVSNTRESIEDDSSPYFRLFAASSLSRIERLIAKDFSSERYAEIMPSLREFIHRSARNIGVRDLTPTQESILRLCTLTFREADACYRLGEIASDSIKILSRFSPDTVPSGSDSSRIYNTVTEIRQKIETCTQSVPRKGGTYALFEQLLGEAQQLYIKHPHLEKEKYSGDAYAAMLVFLHRVSELASPYLLLIDNKDAATLRSEVSRIRRTVREVADATSTVGSRATAASALAAIGQYACTFDGEDGVLAIADTASDEISSIPDGLGSSERVYTVAIDALTRIVAESNCEEIRSYATKAHIDLAERRTIYHFLVTLPVEAISNAFHDPTDREIYSAAESAYQRLSRSDNRFRIDFVTGVIRDFVNALRTLTSPGEFYRIRSLSKALYQSVEELEGALRDLPTAEGETFVPPTIYARVKQIHDRFDLLFSLSKTATSAYYGDPERTRIAERITLLLYQGLVNFDAIASKKDADSLDRIPATCRTILDDVSAALHTISLSEECLAQIRTRIGALSSALSFPSPLDESATDSDCNAAFLALLRRVQKELSYIPEITLRFREESPDEKAGGCLPLYRCETVAQTLSDFLTESCEHPDSLSADSLCRTVADHLAYRASRKGASDEAGIIAVYDQKGRPSGQNNTAYLSRKKSDGDAFRPIVQNIEETYRLHGLSVSPTSVTSSECVTIGGARYVARSYPHKAGGRDYYLVTFTSVEETLSLKQACENDNTVVALISLDNLEELAQYVRIDYREAEKEVERVLRTWAGEIHGIFHEYERDKYILFFSQKEMAALVNSKFSDVLTALESIKLGDSSVSVTVSMGLSALGDTLTIKEQNAALALDMALKRGGAQIVIFRDAENQEDRYEFLSGNRVKGLQKEGRAGARVVASYLCELIRKSGNVLVMGHNFPDFDSIGSCVGIAALARYYKKEVHIVVNRNTQNFRDCTPDLLALPEYQNVFVDGTTGMELKGTDTLLVLCDVSNTNIMESRDIARTSFNTVIIDHHFKTTDSDDLKTQITYIDPSASSASELVSEILEAVLPPDALRKEEANLLLSGIMVDTKNFTRSVGARTFAAALYLRQVGANAEISSTYFYEESSDYKIEVIFRKNLDFHKTHREVAVTFCGNEDLAENPELSGSDLRVAASKAADKLLTVRGIRASFALYPYVGGGKEGIAISGRSDGSINVQQILEAFHGGGHFDSAGATLPEQTISDTIDALYRVIDDYFREEAERAEEDILN